MAVTNKVVVSDLGSQLVEEMRLQLNKVTLALQALVDAAQTDADTWFTNVGALTELDDFKSILTSLTLPPAPSLDEG